MATNEILTPRFMLEIVNGIPISRAYIGLGYLPMRQVSDEELTWDVLKDEQELAAITSIDGHIVPGNDPIYGQMFSDICRIGKSRNVSESEWRKLRDPGMVGIRTGVVADIRAEVERKIAQKIANCNREVDATIEYLCISALLGYISWPPPGLSSAAHGLGNAHMTIDFNFPSDHKIRMDNETVFGSGAAMLDDATNCDVAKMFQIIAEKMEDDAGVSADNLDILLCRRQVRLMGESTKLRDIMKYTNIQGILAFGAIRQYMEEMYGVRLRLYTGTYTYREVDTSDASKITIKRQRILPTNRMLVIPRGVRLGDFATSPAQANNWRTGKFTWRKTEENPWRTEIGVGINGFPRLSQTNSIFVIQTEEDPTGLKDVT